MLEKRLNKLSAYELLPEVDNVVKNLCETLEEWGISYFAEIIQQQVWIEITSDYFTAEMSNSLIENNKQASVGITYNSDEKMILIEPLKN